MLKELSLDNFNKAIRTITSDIGTKKSSGSNTKRTQMSSTEYKNYRPMRIPQDIITASYQTGTWTRIFNSDKKIIFMFILKVQRDRCQKIFIMIFQIMYLIIQDTIIYHRIRKVSLIL